MSQASLLKDGLALHGSKVFLGVVSLSLVHAIACRGAKCASDEKEPVDEDAAGFTAMLAPFAQQLTMGGFLGFCSGYALKTTGKVAAFGVGGVFIMLQTMQYFGYINVNWSKVQAK